MAYLYPDPREDLKNLAYLLKHKYYVYEAGRQLGLPRTQLLKHDLSKLSPQEWTAYKEYFFDKHSKTKAQKEDLRVAFRRAVVNSHYARNKHHRQYYVQRHLRNIPTKYKLEMLADWYGVQKARNILPGGANFTDYMKKSLNKIDTHIIDNKTKDIVRQRLKLSEFGANPATLKMSLTSLGFNPRTMRITNAAETKGIKAIMPEAAKPRI